ncbi:MAG: L-threonylcarbamoyladenylate synthase [Candidatus Adiutricales bacterium]|jgi:tRNA threonylcarbamoyl adenosine modification protein (Sua5/YciO/YrdC/YwlC family)
MILKLDPVNPQPRHITRVTEALREGKIIAYPTDTYYGIGCDLYQKKAIEKIYRLKKRSLKKPFSFICADLKDISQYARVSNYAYRTMRRLLPGPYTFILDGTRLVPKIMLSPRKEAGIRVPDSQICMALVKALGNPIITTTASNAADVPLTDPQEIETLFKDSIEIVIDGGAVPSEPSTVVSLIEDTPKIIRKGLGEVDSIW